MKAILATVCLLYVMISCSPTEPQQEIILFVADHQVDCIGEVPQRCLLVKESPNETWQSFYGSIDGFTYEPGFTYRLRVTRTRIENPPADGSSLIYRLVQVLEKRK